MYGHYQRDYGTTWMARKMCPIVTFAPGGVGNTFYVATGRNGFVYCLPRSLTGR